ncbi:MAG: C13 family peptidase [Leptospirales bacterium]
MLFKLVSNIKSKYSWFLPFLLFLLFGFNACGAAAIQDEIDPDAFAWKYKAILISGDSSITAFDNARESVKRLLVSKGVKPGDIYELSRIKAKLRGRIKYTTEKNIENAFKQLKVGLNSACMIFMSSHGSEYGFSIDGVELFTPDELNALLIKYCGTQPAVVIVSACYSGIFTNNKMLHPNRVIMTAARKDRTSFGCGVENQYTYYDGCLVANLSAYRTWRSVALSARKCIERKEVGLLPSLPQIYIGQDVRTLQLPTR